VERSIMDHAGRLIFFRSLFLGVVLLLIARLLASSRRIPRQGFH
jgi:hypothetical protein